MRKTIIFLLIAFTIAFSFAVGNILNPHQGWEFLIEEIGAFFLLVFGFIFFNKIVEKTVQKLEKTLSWKTHLTERILKESGIILLFTSGSTLLVTGLLWVAWNSFEAIPQFYAKKELKVHAINDERHFYHADHPPPHRRPLPPRDELERFSFFRFGSEIFLSNLTLFLLLFGMEEFIAYSKRRQQFLLEEEQLAKQQALSKASALQNQLNPHFMFNTLNVLSGLIHEDIDKADQFIKKLSDIYRYFLEQNDEIVVSLEKELTFIENYIYLQKIRFEDKLLVDISIPAEKKECLLPSLSLELLVGNAIKHNIISAAKPLRIDIFTEGNFLVVKNNLQIRKDAVPSHGMGLKNLKERLHLLGLDTGSFKTDGDHYIARVPLLNPE